MSKSAHHVRAGRLGGLVKSSRVDPVEGTRAAREGFFAKFEQSVDPDGVLEPAERARRAEIARRVYMLELAQRSAESRRARVAASNA